MLIYNLKLASNSQRNGSWKTHFRDVNSLRTIRILRGIKAIVGIFLAWDEGMRLCAGFYHFVCLSVFFFFFCGGGQQYEFWSCQRSFAFTSGDSLIYLSRFASSGLWLATAARHNFNQESGMQRLTFWRCPCLFLCFPVVGVGSSLLSVSDVACNEGDAIGSLHSLCGRAAADSWEAQACSLCGDCMKIFIDDVHWTGSSRQADWFWIPWSFNLSFDPKWKVSKTSSSFQSIPPENHPLQTLCGPLLSFLEGDFFVRFFSSTSPHHRPAGSRWAAWSCPSGPSSGASVCFWWLSTWWPYTPPRRPICIAWNFQRARWMWRWRSGGEAFLPAACVERLAGWWFYFLFIKFIPLLGMIDPIQW